MAVSNKASYKSFLFEDDLCEFLRSEVVGCVISIIKSGNGYVLFYNERETEKPIVKEKTQKGVK